MSFTKLRDLFLSNQKKRQKRLKELHKAVRENFPDQSRRSYVIALAGDRKVTWKPGFIKSGISAFKAEMRFECYDIKTGSPVNTTVWWTYNGSKSKGDVKGASGTLSLEAKFLIFHWEVKAWGSKTSDIVIFYYE